MVVNLPHFSVILENGLSLKRPIKDPFSCLKYVLCIVALHRFSLCKVKKSLQTFEPPATLTFPKTSSSEPDQAVPMTFLSGQSQHCLRPSLFFSFLFFFSSGVQ